MHVTANVVPWAEVIQCDDIMIEDSRKLKKARNTRESVSQTLPQSDYSR